MVHSPRFYYNYNNITVLPPPLKESSPYHHSRGSATCHHTLSGGENLSSVEVESVLYTFPDINEAAVVARPDEFWGETPCAFVTLKEACCKSATEKEIIEYCRARLPHYMVPKTVVVTEELPKTATGKIQKALLRDMAKDMGSSRVSRM
ncbi:hypothetical protein H0E87_025301 [Populus deltoides]|uniref:AMP-binding enzyme C-terminal domain-containing protein n=1 Tax=Populus deltoides TaxID=3696 RepID=A0A8T2WZB4_POPDE|nr:hypothetical protein H0E87_025301 [Populus deltoides]